MQCPRCDCNNPENARYCNGCGHRLTAPLPTAAPTALFDDKLKKIQRYLPEGLTEKILSEKDKIEGERRQITVMFCDMVNFTAMVDRLGSESAYRFMDRVYEILIHSVHDFGGTVNEMTGDGIMALFGAPIALEDAPYRALRAALSIHREIARFGREKSDVGPIGMRIGVHTGPAVVGTLGNDLRVEFKAVGNTVNLASRVEGLAAAGTTYVTDETFKLTRDWFRFEPIGEKTVRGRQNTVVIYRLLSARKQPGRPGIVSRKIIRTEMVGREAELNLLAAVVERALGGQGALVNVIGEAGIGKSRLMAELKNRPIMHGVTLLEGQATAMGKNLGFHPLIDILKQWARIGNDDGNAVAFDKLQGALCELLPQEAEEMLPFLAIMMRIKLPDIYIRQLAGIEGESLEKLILKNVRQLIVRAAELSPLVIVVEDFHWADASSIAILEPLHRLAQSLPVVFISVFRPGYTETGDTIAEAIRQRFPEHHIEIRLNPLDLKTSEALIARMLKIGEFPPALIAPIARRSGGNPYFMEELVRSLIDQQATVFKDGKFNRTDRIDDIALPHTVNDVLMARVDRLPPDTRKLLMVAAVIGTHFFDRILRQVAAPLEDIDDKLHHLVKIQILRSQLRMDEVEYHFNHALAQEAVYASILPERRKRLHLLVATAIETVFATRLHDFYGMLAFHYSRSDHLEKAEKYLILAGEASLQSSASSEALSYYRQALDLYVKQHGGSIDPGKTAELQKNIAIALFNRGQYEDAIACFDKAMTDGWGRMPAGGLSRGIRILSSFVHFLLALYVPAVKFRETPTPSDIEIIDLLHKKGKALTVLDPKKFFFESLYLCENVARFDLNGFDLGLQIFMSASALFSFTGISFSLSRKVLDTVQPMVPADNTKLLTTYDLLETTHHYFNGNWSTIRNHDDALVEKNLALGEVWDASAHLYWHGLANIYKGDLPSVRSAVSRLNQIVDIYDNDFSILAKYRLHTNLLMEWRHFDQAMVEVEKAVDFVQKRGLGLSLVNIYACKARLHYLMGDIDTADTVLMQAEAIRSEFNAAPVQLACFFQSRLEVDLYHLQQSLQTSDRSAITARRRQARRSVKQLFAVSRKAAQHRTESYKLAGFYCWLTGKTKRALDWWEKAFLEGERLDARPELARTYFLAGTLLASSDNPHRSIGGLRPEDCLERARAMFAQMDLQWDLKQWQRTAESN